MERFTVLHYTTLRDHIINYSGYVGRPYLQYINGCFGTLGWEAAGTGLPTITMVMDNRFLDARTSGITDNRYGNG